MASKQFSTHVFMPGSLRTIDGQQKYDDYRKTLSKDTGCALCEEKPLQSFRYWKILENNFPYDKIASTHHMIVPLRHIQESELTNEELKEFSEIKLNVLNQSYDYTLEASTKNKSIPAHYHLHLVVLKM